MPEIFCYKNDTAAIVRWGGGGRVEGRQIFASNFDNKCFRNWDIGNQTVEKVKHCLRSFSSRFNIHFIFAEYVPV
jgi:hypothetical protein